MTLNELKTMALGAGLVFAAIVFFEGAYQVYPKLEGEC
jgi:hypothetical protein